MKNILKHYAKYLLLDTFAVAVLFTAAHAILSLFHLMFIKWIYFAVIGIVIIGILLGIFQLLLKIRKTYIKYIAMGIMTICLIPLTYIGILVFAFTYQPMHIVKKDEIKYVAYVRAFLHTYVDYYEYRNSIITGNEVLFTEDFGKGGFDPFEEGYTDNSMIEEETITDDRAEQNAASDGVTVKATHYIIINELYAEDGLREYVYQIKFEDEFGNEADSTAIVNFYLIDTETLAVTDEKTNVWH